MITPEILLQIFRRADSDEMLFDYDEMRKWSKATRCQLIALKLLHRAAPAPSSDCFECERQCLALPVKRDETRQPYLECPKHIRVDISNESLDRCQVDINEIASRIARGLESPCETRITNHLWMVGQVDIGAVRTSVFLARVLRRTLDDNLPPILDIPMHQPSVVIVPNLRNYENISSEMQEMITLDEVLVLSNGNISVSVSAIGNAANRVQARLAGTTAVTQTEPRYLFKKGVDTWNIIYDDVKVDPPLIDAKGLDYIRFLLEHPNTEYFAMQIEHEVDGSPYELNRGYSRMDAEQLCSEGFSVSHPTNAEPIIDEEAEQDYRRRLSQAEGTLELSEARNDPEGIALANHDISHYRHALSEGVGLYGSRRGFVSELSLSSDRVRQSIKRELDKIKIQHRPLYDHLISSSLGKTIKRARTYKPGELPPWLF